MVANPSYYNLGNPTTFRETSWLDLCIRAWGSEFQAPDHDVYKWSNGRGFDSTDRGLTGVYGVKGEDPLLVSGSRYPDMRDAVWQSVGLGQFPGASPPYTGSYANMEADQVP